MATLLEKPLKREILVGKDSYVVILTLAGLKLTVKGRRNGLELSWQDLVNGEAALRAVPVAHTSGTRVIGRATRR